MWLENLKEARIRAGNPTFKEIAKKALCSERTISRIFNEKTKFPDTPTLKGICEALNTTLDAILEGTNTSVGDIDDLKEQIKALTEEVDRLGKLVELLEKDLAHKNEVIGLKNEIIETYKRFQSPLLSSCSHDII